MTENIVIQKQALLSKIHKFKEKEYEEILSMQQKGFDIMESTKDSYNDIVNLYSCYDKLSLQPIEDEEDLKKVEWLFNEGKLRSNKELEEFEENEQREQYGSSKEFSDFIFETFELDETFGKRLWYLTFIFTPVIPFCLCFLHESSDSFTNEVTYLSFNLACLLSFAVHFGVFMGLKNIISIILDRVVAREYKKTNLKKPFPINTAISAASYAIFMASLFKKPKKK